MPPYANGDRNNTKSNIEQIEVNRLNFSVFYSEDDDDVLSLKNLSDGDKMLDFTVK